MKMENMKIKAHLWFIFSFNKITKTQILTQNNWNSNEKAKYENKNYNSVSLILKQLNGVLQNYK